MDLVPFREDFEYKPQRRKDSAHKIWNQRDIAGADFETKDGYPHIFSWSQFENGGYVDRHCVFGGTVEDPTMFLDANGGEMLPTFNIKTFCMIMMMTGRRTQGGAKKKGGKSRSRKTPPQLYFFNLKFDAGSIIKTLSTPIIERLMQGDDTIVNVNTWEYDPRVRRESKGAIKGWIIDHGDDDHERVPFNTYIRVSYLAKKFLQFEPINFFTDGDRWGKVSCWDIAQFCGGGSLNFNALKHLGESKIDFTKDQMKLMGSLSPEGIDFTRSNWDKILEYAEKDSNLTARLSWLIVNRFESRGIRMVKPFSAASVAERAAYDLCDIPTMNDLIKDHEYSLNAFWTSYQGGLFESTGSGFWPNVYAKDITSAYPHVMWWCCDITDGIWMGTFYGDPSDQWSSYLDRDHVQYRPSCFEAEVIFPEGMEIYPASKTSANFGCLVNARINYGWFTGDEIIEFQKWGAEIYVDRWCAFVPFSDNDPAPDVEDGIRYPFRPFVERFYGGKLHQDELKVQGSPDYDPEERQIFKTMVCSLYGKTCQAIDKGEYRITGQMWSSVYASIITAGCRMRIAEIIRVNKDLKVLSVATDGVIFAGDPKVPDNSMPVYFNDQLIDLGDWTDDGSGDLLLMMSGVYSVIRPDDHKNTYRGTYAMFLDRADEDRYGQNWLEFCLRYADQESISRDPDDNPVSRPYSIGEAKMKKDYSLINQFRVVVLTITACGDSNKRRWECKPITFGDLADNWWNSHTWESMI